MDGSVEGDSAGPFLSGLGFVGLIRSGGIGGGF